MKSTAMLKLAASALIFGSTMVGCSPAGQAMRPANPSDMKIAKIGEKAASQALKAMAKKDFARAVVAAETAVGAMPKDANYRMLLGQAYLGAGRFASAETAFSETLLLSPGHDRAALNLALVSVAQGKTNAAMTTLNEHREKLAAVDYGLAMALAGDTGEAVRVLEVAVRTPGADAKARQNLALAYALAGDWNASKVMAGQDLAPAETDARMLQWAEFSRPNGGAAQVAALLGVTPVADPGQPTRLALLPSARETVQVALAGPVAPPVAKPVAAAEPVAPAPAVFETVPVARAPVAAPMIQAVATPVKQAIVPLGRPAVAASKFPARAPGVVEGGKFVVQLGAFESAAVSHDAWKRLAPRYNLRAFDPSTSTAKVSGANYVRLSVGGFATHGDAKRVCVRIQKVGGNCFVRGMLSDRPAYWVQRGMPKPVRVASR